LHVCPLQYSSRTLPATQFKSGLLADKLSEVDFVLLSLVSFYFVFISLISFRFVSFLLISFRFVSFRFVFVDFVSFRFVSFLFRCRYIGPGPGKPRRGLCISEGPT
jgi:hypothetical protein